MGDFEEALANFNDTLLYLRGNRYINYEQLGLKYKLYSCEVLFNRGLCSVYLKQKEAGMVDLKYAAKEKETADHDVIDEAIQEGAEASCHSIESKGIRLLTPIKEFTVFSIGVGIIYRPNSAKVKNLKSKDYLGKARLIASFDNSHIAGPDSKKAALQAATGRSLDDRPAESISFAASNLVRPNLHSRGARQQSEPPIHRNVFPPTPPPENETEKLRPTVYTPMTSPPSKPPSLSYFPQQESNPQEPKPQERRSPPPNHPLRPEPLKLSQSTFTSLDQKEPAPRIGTTRSASERPSQREPLRRDRDSRESRRLFMETTPVPPMSGGDADIDERLEEERYSPSSSLKSQHHRTQSSLTSTSDRSQQSTSSRMRSRRSRSRRPISRRTHYSIEEENEEETTGGSSLDEYEILHNAGGTLSKSPPLATLPKTTYNPSPSDSISKSIAAPATPVAAPIARKRAQSERPRYKRASSSSTGSNRRHHHPAAPLPQPTKPIVELINIRIKMHHADDTRFLMLSPETSFAVFLERVKEKLKLDREKECKVRVRDEEGDWITLGDDDDWDIALQGVKRGLEEDDKGKGSGGEGGSAGANGAAGGIGIGMGKMEVWVA